MLEKNCGVPRTRGNMSLVRLLSIVVGLQAAMGGSAFHVNFLGNHSGSKFLRTTHRTPTNRVGMSMSENTDDMKRLMATSAAALLVAFSPLHAFADTEVVEFNPVQQLVQKTTEEQQKRLKKDQQRELGADAQMGEGSLIARVIVSIKSDTYALGFPDISSFPALDTDKSSLIVTAFGQTGPPVAAKRLTLKGRQFPVALELTDNDLTFPLTKEAWGKDGRGEKDIGVAVVLDPDGKIATLEGVSLTGYGVSKPLMLGGSMERTEALIEVQPNRVLQEQGQDALGPDEIDQLSRIDSMLDLKEAKAGRGDKVF